MAPVRMPARTLSAVRSGYLAAVEPGRLARARRTAPPLSAEPLVSIPLATFDRAGIVLERTLPALIEQTYERIEVVLVGDGCPPEVADRLAAFRHPKVRFRNLRRRSSYPSDPVHRWMVAGSRPRDVGARLATGDALVWMSDDDVLYPDAVEKLLTALLTNDAEVALGGTDIASGLEVRAGGGAPLLGPPASKVWMARTFLRRFRWSRTSWMKHWNRPCDLDLFARMQHAGVRFVATDDPICIVLPVEGTDLHGSAAWRALYGDGNGRESMGGT